MPFAHLLGEPDRVLLGVENVEDYVGEYTRCRPGK